VKLCINQVTLGERSLREVAEASSKAGFSALELWLPSVEQELAAGLSVCDARAVLGDNGVVAVGACFVSGLLASEGDARREAFDVAKARFELSQELGAAVIACVGDGPQKPTAADYALAAERAREIGDLAESFGLTIALEFVAGMPFLGTLATAARVVAEADHPHVGVLFDMFHFYAGRSKVADFAELDGTGIAFVHLNDARGLPREIIRDADRVLPGEGALPLRQLAGHIADSGYDGYYSLELFNEELQSLDPAEAATRAYEACRRLGL